MTIYTLLTHPDLVAGAVPMSGRLIPAAWENRADDDALRGKPVFSVHGLYDQVLPISSGREIRDRLQSVPLDYTYREYPMGHEVSLESVQQAQGWLAQVHDGEQPREAMPEPEPEGLVKSAKKFLGDPDAVTRALRDYVWSIGLNGGTAPAGTTPPPETKPAGKRAAGRSSVATSPPGAP